MFKKPIAVLGAGARSNIVYIKKWLEDHSIPFLVTWGGMDLIESHHPLNFGGFGVVGPRLGNKIIQSADVIMPIGASLNQQVTGNPLWFATKAEIHKDRLTYVGISDGWYRDIEQWKKEFKHEDSNWDVCPYKFMDSLNTHTKEGDILVTDAGGNLCQTFQRIKIKKDMRVFTAFNNSPMGYSLPAAIGAQFAMPESRVLCVLGDGGLMMCGFELATVVRHDLPIKIFLFNNQGHGIQKQTKRTWLNGRLHGADEESGLGFPNYEKLADSFGINYAKIQNNKGFYILDQIMEDNEAWLVDVAIDQDAEIRPFLKSGQRLEEI